ncbi:MAG: ABC transporter permease [Bacteroidota bacterium]
MNLKPPKRSLQFLRWFCREDYLEEIEGDLTEVFINQYEISPRKAKWKFRWSVVKYFRPEFMKSFKSYQPNSYGMYKSYFKIGWRNLLKSKAYSLINISGLAIGLACAMAIGLFIQDEYSYDRFHPNASDIYRVVQQQNQAGELYDVASSPGLMGEALKADFPEVLKSCLLGYQRSGVLQQGTITVESSAITMADPGFLQLFDFPLLLGNPDKVFTEPNQVVITDRMAANLFGGDWMTDSQLLGKTIIYKSKEGERTLMGELILAGVIKEPPVNSHLQFEVILTYDPKGDNNSNWNSNNFLTYIQLNPDANPADLNRKLEGYINKYRSAENRTFKPPVFYLQPLTDIYLHSDFDFQTDWTKTSSIVYVRIFFAVGMIVLVIAVFNFINLSTARAIRRAKEVGIRKTIGAYRSQLMTQFLSESFLITGISVVLALVLMNIGLPFLNAVASKSLMLPVTELNFAVALLLFIVIVSLIAGFYPSIYLSGFQPTKVLKGVFDIRSGRRFRQVLVVTQFTFTVILVAGSIIIYKQLDFLRDKKLGFDKSQLIYLETDNLSKEHAQLLKSDFQKQSAIIGASSTSNGLIDVINSTVGFEWEGKSSEEDRFLITRLNVDPSYLSTTGMKLISGRNFNSEILTDTTAYMINESAAKRMGWTPVEALEKSFTLYGAKGLIIGVVEDFHYRPMTAAIEPLVFSYMPSRYYSGLMVKAGPNQVKESIALIEELYKKYDPATSAHYSFVDQQLENQYQFEQRTGKVVFFFSMLAIFVACLGLYGLATFNAERRTKEIGIRKVMGASVINVGALLSKDFIYLIVLSIIIASPLGYFLMRSWLEGFVYRIELDWRFFVAAGSLPLSVAILTVFYQAVAAARMDPVKSLRSE